MLGPVPPLRELLGTGRDVGREAFRIFSERGARLMSGSIAFYALVSVVPILVIALHVASLFVDSREADAAIASELARWVGARGAQTIGASIAAVRSQSGTGLTSVVGVLVLIYASTRLFAQITTALDLLWETPPAPRPASLLERARRQVSRRGLAFLMVLGIGLLLIGTVLFHGALAAARHAVGLEAPVSRLIEMPVSLLLTALLFAAMFRFLPRARVESRDALLGGLVTSVLFTLGSWAITAYVAHSDASVYGAAASIVMLLVWVHYSAQAFFLGAAFTAVSSRRRARLPASGEGAK